VVKLVDTRDSKSRALKSVSVRVRPLVPNLSVTKCKVDTAQYHARARPEIEVGAGFFVSDVPVYYRYKVLFAPEPQYGWQRSITSKAAKVHFYVG
jgi:hypothetical protein